jgi:hypothetical protein
MDADLEAFGALLARARMPILSCLHVACTALSPVLIKVRG